MAQTNAGAGALPRGSRVVLVVSQGAAPDQPAGYVQVPDLVGAAQGDALESAQAAGLQARVFNDYSDKYKRGDVVGHVPRANASAPVGTEIVMLVSSGAPVSEQGVVGLPDLIGARETEATQQLQAMGLNPQVAFQYSPVVPAGVVIDQLPNSADLTAAPKQSKAWIWIALAVALAVLAIGAFFLFRTPAKMVEVPDVVGKTQAEATKTLEEAGFTVTFEEAEDPGDAEEGEVVAQDPEAKTEAAEGTPVKLSIAGAPKAVAVPDVIGMTEEDATKKLEEVGLRANARTREDASAKPGTVLEQSPTAGAELAPGERVDITVAKEPAEPTQVKVPDVTGMSQGDAEKALEDAGVVVVVVKNPSEDVAKGDVVGQLPTAGTIVAPNSEVVIVVSTGPSASEATVKVPDVMGSPKADAEAAIKAAGLKAQSVGVAGTSETAGNVFAQVPDPGTMLPANSTVTILYAQ